MSQEKHTGEPEDIGQRPDFSAARIAEILAEPPKPALVPTAEQRTMIEQPLGGSVLVVAGAGSGKTETMANRVVWLVANGLVSPAQILGLTFTRKAAGELAERIAERLGSFMNRLIDLRERGELSGAERQRADGLEETLSTGIDLPEVSTYNSFAAGIVQEFGAFAGIPSTATLIDEAAAWRLAREVVCASDDPGLITAKESIATLVKRVLSLDHAVSDNLTTFGHVDRVTEEFLRTRSLPKDEKSRNLVSQPPPTKDLQDDFAAVEGTRMISRLAQEYADEKSRRGVIEFSDQLRLAVETVDAFPGAAAILRGRTPVVLLDEVQDTSVGQTRLLSKLFAGTSVMAVGDPNQSIYGWRGASSENLTSFHREFSGPGQQVRDAVSLTLSTSWRNPSAVLHAANTVAEPLNDESPLAVPRLRSREEEPGEGSGRAGDASVADDANAERIRVAFTETIDEEFERLAAWVRDERAAHVKRTGEQATAAVICRRRAVMPAIADALDRLGVPNRIVGVGGLLTTPEVTDLVSALRCLWYPDAGNDLIRLLVGPRFSVGIADIDGLRRCAHWFSERDGAQQRVTDEDRARQGVLRDPDREFTILDALDEIGRMPKLEHASLRAITQIGRERLRDAGRMLASLRRVAGAGVLDLMRATIEALRIDIELDANERSEADGSASARANLDAFHDLVEGFLRTDEQGTLPSVLAWLERVREIDQEAEHVPEPQPGTVQLITVHGSKGLEWDLVAVPRLVDREFPVPTKEGRGWLRAGELPDELRGDAAARPCLNWRIATTLQDLREAIGVMKTVKGERYRTEGYLTELAARHAQEERRLAYVAITRAASQLLLTGSFWSAQKKPRGPSPYLVELAEAGIIADLPEESAFDEDPKDRPPREARWPLDALGSRRDAVQRAAEAVRARLDDVDPDDDLVDPTVRLLIAERNARGRGSDSWARHALPDRITASTFHEFVETPEESQRRLLRPLPLQPYRRTRTGNRFHEWVERRATTPKGTEVPLFVLSAEPAGGRENEDVDSEAPESSELEALIDTFTRSRWGTLKPIAVEQEVTLPFAGRRLVCKLDAVYQYGEGDTARFEVVDWKTGRPPRTDEERESRFFQLDLYRLAYAEWAGVAPERIDTTLFYVAADIELRSARSRSFTELEQIWWEAAGRLKNREESEDRRGRWAPSPAQVDRSPR